MSRDRLARAFGTRSSWALATAITLVGFVMAQSGKEAKPDAPAPKAAASNKYIGADKCKNCHMAEASGNQHGVWTKEMHSKAFETLASDKAKEIAKAKGIADAQKSDACLKCHTTAFGVAADLIKKGFDAKRGVQCEACHGPGDQHVKARMAAMAKEEESKAGEYKAIPADEIVSKVDQKTCLGCHNEESPTFKPFCFQERSAKIAHLDPRKPRKAEEKLVCGCSPCACAHGSEAACAVPAKK